MSAVRLSYIIPAYNARRWLERTLPMHAAQTVREGVEWIVVLSGPGATADATWLDSAFPGFRTLVSERQWNVSEARNAGAEAAQGAWLAFMDADVAVPPGHARNLLERLEPGMDFMGGPLLNGRSRSMMAWADWFLTLGEYGRTRRPEKRTRIPGCQMIFSRALWERTGGFDVQWPRSQDMEICHRVARLGVACHYDPALAVHHLDQPGTLREMLAHQRLYALGAARLRLAGMGNGSVVSRHAWLWPLIPPLRWMAALARILRKDPQSLGWFLLSQPTWWLGVLAYARAFGTTVREHRTPKR